MRRAIKETGDKRAVEKSHEEKSGKRAVEMLETGMGFWFFLFFLFGFFLTDVVLYLCKQIKQKSSH